LLRRWREKGYGFPYLIDESQDVARAFGAVCTPDIYVFDRERKLAYHGRIDDNWQRPEKVARRELAAALDALLAGRRPSAEQHNSIGCSIKWRKAG
ncbi:MAG: redoxin domain-containing protein, partial [Deltaproteobacteria bacterium]